MHAHVITYTFPSFKTITFIPSFHSTMISLLLAMARSIDPKFPEAPKYKEEKTSGHMYHQTLIRYGNAKQGIEYTSYDSEPESYYDPGSTTVTLCVYGLQKHRLEIIHTSDGRSPPSYTFKVEGEENNAQRHYAILQQIYTLLTERGISDSPSITTNELLQCLPEIR